jgi:hypothetical protein
VTLGNVAYICGIHAGGRLASQFLKGARTMMGTSFGTRVHHLDCGMRLYKCERSVENNLDHA